MVISKGNKKMTSFTAKLPKEQSLVNLHSGCGGNSSTSSQLLMDRGGFEYRGGIAVGSSKRLMACLPRTYADLVAKFTVSVKRDPDRRNLSNIAIGQFPLSKVPDGKYRIYYFRPKNRNRLIG